MTSLMEDNIKTDLKKCDVSILLGFDWIRIRSGG
jgi:hypothetical protein